MSAPCAPWDVRWPCDISCESPTVTGQAVALASATLWGLSGRQFGLCEVTLRPCRRECYSPWPYGWAEYSYPQPALVGGQWFNLICGGCGDNCSCSVLSEVVLPSRTDSVSAVKVDGLTLATTAYRLDD